MFTPGRRSGLDFSRHRRARRTSSSTATSCRSTRAIPTPASSCSPRSPARTRTRSRRASRRARERRRASGKCPICPIDPRRPRPHLRGGHPRQQPVRQGRRRVRAGDAITACSCRAICSIEFSQKVQARADQTGDELSSATIFELFRSEFLEPPTPAAGFSLGALEPGAGPGAGDLLDRARTRRGGPAPHVRRRHAGGGVRRRAGPGAPPRRRALQPRRTRSARRGRTWPTSSSPPACRRRPSGSRSPPRRSSPRSGPSCAR